MKIISANVSKTDEQFEQFEATVSVQSNGVAHTSTCRGHVADEVLQHALGLAIAMHTTPLYASLNVKLTVEF